MASVSFLNVGWSAPGASGTGLCLLGRFDTESISVPGTGLFRMFGFRELVLVGYVFLEISISSGFYSSMA